MRSLLKSKLFWLAAAPLDLAQEMPLVYEYSCTSPEGSTYPYLERVGVGKVSGVNP